MQRKQSVCVCGYNIVANHYYDRLDELDNLS